MFDHLIKILFKISVFESADFPKLFFDYFYKAFIFQCLAHHFFFKTPLISS